MRKLTHGSLFTGVGMIDYGLHLAGWETSYQVEVNEYCRAVLRKHRDLWPDAVLFDDVKAVGSRNLPKVDLISGGFPCTDVSVAGVGLRRKGGKIDGIGTPDNPSERSGLWYQFHRIVHELRPAWVLIENVARLFHTGDGGRVVRAMESEGYACWPILLGTECLGTPHERTRTWTVCRHVDAHRDRDLRGEVEVELRGDLPDNLRREIAEKSQHWSDWKRKLGTGNARPGGAPEEPGFDAHSRGVRAVHGYPNWVDRIKCCGNSVVWVVPAAIGAWIARIQEKAEAGAA